MRESISNRYFVVTCHGECDFCCACQKCQDFRRLIHNKLRSFCVNELRKKFSIEEATLYIPNGCGSSDLKKEKRLKFEFHEYQQ